MKTKNLWYGLILIPFIGLYLAGGILYALAPIFVLVTLAILILAFSPSTK